MRLHVFGLDKIGYFSFILSTYNVNLLFRTTYAQLVNKYCVRQRNYTRDEKREIKLAVKISVRRLEIIHKTCEQLKHLNY